MEILGKTKLYPRKSHEIVLHLWETPRSKIKTYGKLIKIQNEFFSINPGNPTSFSVDEWNIYTHIHTHAHTHTHTNKQTHTHIHKHIKVQSG